MMKSSLSQFRYVKINFFKLFQKVSTLLGNKEWFIHNQLTLADFIFYEAFSYFAALWPEKLANYQNLVDFRARFEAIP